MELSKKERKRLRLEKLRQQSEKARIEHEQRQQASSSQNPSGKNKSFKFYAIISIAFAVVIIAGALVYSYSKPGPYDNFAKCLSEKGAVMYGADWCKYTQAQRAMFGNSFKYINYKDFTKGPDIKVTPTWIIKGERLEKTQSFDVLSKITGCSIS